MNIIKSMKYTATVTIGLQKNYSQNRWSKHEVISKLQYIQNQLIEVNNIYLSASISECEIVLSGQLEQSLKLDFINYPKFHLTEKLFTEHVLGLTKKLMVLLSQNRIVIIFHNNIIMLENNAEIDPRIKKPNL